MNEQNEEIEIDLLRLFRFILSKFKTLLILGIVFAVLGFSYKYCRFEFSSTPLAEVNNLFTIEKIEKEPDGKVVKKKRKFHITFIRKTMRLVTLSTKVKKKC